MLAAHSLRYCPPWQRSHPGGAWPSRSHIQNQQEERDECWCLVAHVFLMLCRTPACAMTMPTIKMAELAQSSQPLADMVWLVSQMILDLVKLMAATMM